MIRSGRFLFGVIFALLSIVVPALADAQSPTTQSITDPRGRFAIWTSLVTGMLSN